jgi:hypothetical protein
MLGTTRGPKHLVGVLQEYETILDDLLREDAQNVSSPWIGTEEDILLMMMQRDASSFHPVRAGDRFCEIRQS